MSRRRKRESEDTELESMREFLNWLEIEQDHRSCARCGANLLHDYHRLTCSYLEDADFIVHYSFGKSRRVRRAP